MHYDAFVMKILGCQVVLKERQMIQCIDFFFIIVWLVLSEPFSIFTNKIFFEIVSKNAVMCLQ